MKVGDRVSLLEDGTGVISQDSGLRVGSRGTVETVELKNIMVLFDNCDIAQALSSDQVKLVKDSELSNGKSIRALRRSM